MPVLDRWVAQMPFGDLLVGVPGPHQECLVEVAADELEGDGKSAVAKATGQRDRRVSRHVKRGGEADK